uniref:U22-Sparatoxin-Hju1y_1 n=1 Tax=Heteropoda jugulans TaxID=1358901 RepID=A0A4Q8KCJ2_9ARAC
MRIIVVMMLLFVTFTAVTLAEKSIEDAALDLVMDRDDDKECIGFMGWCSGKSQSCCKRIYVPPVVQSEKGRIFEGK